MVEGNSRHLTKPKKQEQMFCEMKHLTGIIFCLYFLTRVKRLRLLLYSKRLTLRIDHADISSESKLTTAFAHLSMCVA